MLRNEVTSYQGYYYCVADAVMRPGPVQRPHPRLTIAARGPAMVKLAARYADIWNTEGYYQELRHRSATAADVLRITRERSELLSEHAAALGRDPHAIICSRLVGFSQAPENPWASVDAFQDFVSQYRQIGFSEFIFPEPSAAELRIFECIVREVIPALRHTAVAQSASAVHEMEQP